MTPAMVAQLLLMIMEVSKVAALLKDEDLTPAQAAAVKDAVRTANDIWERT